jgi:hypothetical protein
MHQAGVPALPKKIQQVGRGVHVRRKGVAQVWIEICESSAVHYEIKRFLQTGLCGFIQAQAR